MTNAAQHRAMSVETYAAFRLDRPAPDEVNGRSNANVLAQLDVAGVG